MEPPNLIKIITILTQLPTLLKKVLQFADHLEEDVSGREKLDREIRNGTIDYYDCFKKLFQSWINKKGEEATGQALVKILRDMECRDAAEIVSENIASLTTPFSLTLSFLLKDSQVSLPFPESFPGFILKSYLGHGTFGIVWKAWDETEDEDYALKLLLVSNPQSSEEQNKDLEICKGLEPHRNILKVRDYFEHDVTPPQFQSLLTAGKNIDSRTLLNASKQFEDEVLTIFYIKMDIFGDNLRSWLNLQEKDKESKEVQKMQKGILTGATEGVKYLHNQRIVHKGLKPENIFFSKGYTFPIKIGDYGQQKAFKDGQQDLYTPENLRNEYTFQTDLFSLGLIIFEVIQLIPMKQLRIFFDKFLTGDEQILQPSPVLINFKAIVKMLCISKALENIEDLFLAWVAEGEIFISNSFELKSALNNCEDGWTLTLGEGTFDGPFNIENNNITLKGQGVETILINRMEVATRYEEGAYHTILRIGGANFKASNFKIDGGRNTENFGIIVKNDNCTLENLVIVNCQSGIHNYSLGWTAKDTTIRDVAIIGNGNDTGLALAGIFQVSNTRIEKCGTGLHIQKFCGDSSLKNVSIIDPEKTGITIKEYNFAFGNGTFLKLEDVSIVCSKSSEGPLYGIEIRDCWQKKWTCKFERVKCLGIGRGHEFLIDPRSRAACKLKVVESALGSGYGGDGSLPCCNLM